MKKTLFLICTLLLGVSSYTQITQKFNYQAVVRDNVGMIMPNEIVSIQLAILSNSANGQVEYIENHLVSTNQFGLVKLEVGGGTVINGAWPSIDWAETDHFLRISIDVNGGNNFQFLGTSQLLSVPYAQVAERARIDMIEDADSDPNNEIQDLEIVNGVLSISDGNSVVLPNSNGGSNTDNQTLTLSGNTVSISGGNSIDLSSIMNDADADPLNEIQTLTLTGNQLTISNGNTISLIDNVEDLDSDIANELQNLTVVGDTLFISDGNYVVLPTANASDDQSLVLNGNNLHIESGNTIDLSSFIDNTDEQTLSLNGNQLAISGGNTITLTDNVNDADSDASNELQDIQINANTLSLSNSSSNVDLGAYLDNTDSQTLNFDGNTLSISGGNSVFIPTTSSGGGGDDDQNLAITNDSLFIENGNGIDLSSYRDNTDNQVLQITGDFISIQNGNTVLIDDDVDDADADPTNEIQNIFRQGNFLHMSDDPSTVDLSPYLDNTDEQTLSLSGGLLSISNGNSIPFVDNVDDADADATNELQELNLDNNVLSISNGLSSINLSAYLDNTDAQTLALNGNSLSISGGNAIDISGLSNSQFSTGSNVVFNSGNHANDDFVFGSPTLNQNGNFNHYAKFFFDKSKFGAFRTGYVQNDQWNTANIGESSFAAGYNTKASGDYSVAIGRDASAEGSNSIALGRQNNSLGFASTTIGFGSSANANYSFAGGNAAQALAINSFAFGENVVAGGINSIAIGNLANAGTNGIALGSGADANQTSALAIGTNTSSLLPGAIAIGENVNSEGARSVSIGYNLKAPSYGETVIGYNNSNYTAQNPSFVNTDDRLFTIGNGTNTSNLSDAFIVFKDGDAFLAGNVSTNSDIRLKRNIQPLQGSLEKVLKLQGYTYQWNDKTPRDTEQINTGLIAQELELLFPELISIDGSGYKSVNYIALVPHLIESFKEQAKQIENLSRKLNQQTEIHSDLTVELNDLMKRIQVLEQQLTLGKY